MAKVTLSTGREVETDSIKAVNDRKSYVEIVTESGDINVSREDFELIEQGARGDDE